MEKIQLTLLFKIIGIGSASGLVYQDDKLYLISDNSTFLYEYHIPSEKLNKIPLVENAQENIPKKEKPDFEAIASKEKKGLILLGSGSTDKRNRIFKYEVDTKEIEEEDITKIYQKIQSKLNIKADELNIEGLILDSKDLYLFQRGNGSNGKNGIIFSNDVVRKENFKFIPFELPKVKNVEYTFTDAVLEGSTIYFLATAENTDSTYLDGEVLGSIIGSIDIKTMQLTFTQQISGKHKFEGLTLYKKSTSEIEFLLCEDNDTDALESGIYSLKLSLK